MDVNFAITNPEAWVKTELDSRALANLNPTNHWTSRTPWIHMISNAIVRGADPKLRTQYALYSGNLTSFENSYHVDANDRFKFRPRPGITSAKVEFKGTMGSTKSTTVNFQCWTLDDLMILEKLYMVPGMSIILEWGWSTNTNGDKIQPLAGFKELPSENKNYINEIMKVILKYRKSWAGNYDGLVGIVTNFSYTLNDNLGFDCQIEIISPGEMWLEQNSTNISQGCSDNDNDKQKKQSNLEHKFHSFYTEYKDTKKIDLQNKNTKTVSCVQQNWEVEAREYDKQLRTWWQSVTTGIADKIDPTRNSTEVYISWGTFVKTLNTNINLYWITDTSGNVSIKLDDAGSNPKLGLDLIPVTILPKYMSTDPRICTFKPKNVDPEIGKETNNKKGKAEIIDPVSNVNKSEPESAGIFTTAMDYIGAAAEAGAAVVNYIIDQESRFITTPAEIRPTYPINSLPDYSDKKFAVEQIQIFGDAIDNTNVKLKANAEFSITENDNVGLLNNIFINAGYLRDTIASSADHVNMQDFLNKILTDLNNASGGLWSLQVHIDEADPTRLHIYDANYTSTIARKNQIEPYKFVINSSDSGIAKLLIKGAGVESKLVDGFKTMVLYGNGTDNGNTDNANTGFELYSSGVYDGYVNPDHKAKHSDNCTDINGNVIAASKTTLLDVESDLDEAYYLLLDAVDDESVSGAKNAMSSYLTFLNSKVPEVANTLPRNQNILLPFNFKISMDGFSGLVWGNAIAFDYLPSRYENAVYFQITKINHDITPEGWETNIETVMRLRNNGPKSADIKQQRTSSTISIPNQNLLADEKNIQNQTTFAADNTNGIPNSEKNLIEYQASQTISGGSDISKFFTSK